MGDAHGLRENEIGLSFNNPFNSIYSFDRWRSATRMARPEWDYDHGRRYHTLLHMLELVES